MKSNWLLNWRLKSTKTLEASLRLQLDELVRRHTTSDIGILVEGTRALSEWGKRALAECADAFPDDLLAPYRSYLSSLNTSPVGVVDPGFEFSQHAQKAEQFLRCVEGCLDKSPRLVIQTKAKHWASTSNVVRRMSEGLVVGIIVAIITAILTWWITVHAASK